jgi:uncharacterized protein YprB with RNaseH-like and TPR domain
MLASLDKFSRLAALRPARGSPGLRPATLRAPSEDDPLAQRLCGAIARNRYGEYLSMHNWFSSPEFFEPSPVALELLSRTRDEAFSRRTRAALQDPTKWLFLDTETTGLAGGTGTYAFLIGLAWWDAGGLQVEQFLMRDFAEEHSLLHELAARLAQRPVLLTFNGKSFDWPLLENRFTLTRSIAPPRLAAHLDLLHPARTLWKLRLGSVRLVELERQVLDAPRLGWHREADVPSASIPQYYFDYLRGGPVEPIVSIVHHNQWDLRGLATLFCKMNVLLAAQDPSSEGMDSLDLFGLSRFFQRRGDSARAQTACSQALDLGLPTEFRPVATRELALLAKRHGDHARAARLWEELAADPRDGVLACEQLAIHYARRAKDPARALEFVQLGLAKLRRQRAIGSSGPAVSLRLARLEQKFLNRRARLLHHMRIAKGVVELPLSGEKPSAAAAGSRTR